MDINLVVNIASKSWALPILAALHEGVAGRQARLIAATGAGRTAFAQSLAHLAALELVERNPGHGHPLRPEFRLTPLGTNVAAKAAQIIALAEKPADRLVLRRSWSLPVLVQLQEPRHFSDLRSTLAPITDRALSQSLKTLEAHRWLSRKIIPSHPPRPIYQASNAGAKIANFLVAA